MEFQWQLRIETINLYLLRLSRKGIDTNITRDKELAYEN